MVYSVPQWTLIMDVFVTSSGVAFIFVFTHELLSVSPSDSFNFCYSLS